MKLSQRLVRELLDYDPETGVFARRRNGKQFGGRAQGYPQGKLTIGGITKVYKAHRLAFMWMLGRWPCGEADHINHNRADNRWANLREVSTLDNARNREQSRRNTSGQTGVRRSRWKKFVARIRVNDKSFHLGTFATLQEATAARLAAEHEHGFHKNHGRRYRVATQEKTL